ncbi:MAG: sigma-70 family RNA polymerase sigma factor [bacterium]|nr:sigma-70 family RNA polymerase sigma factor [bacterium]
MNEKDIIDRCRSGQNGMCDLLIERHKTALYSFCRKLEYRKADADDLFQDTWVKAVKNLHMYDGRARFLTWLFTICINLHRDRLRRHFRWSKILKSYHSGDQMETDMADLESKEKRPRETAAEDRRADRLKDALQGLKEKLRLPIILHYYREFSLREISGMLGIPAGTVKSRLSNGRKQLKKILEKDQ